MQELRELPYLDNTSFTADHCIKCNVCTQACPFAAVTPLFPGPKTVGPQAQRFRDPDLPSPDESLEYCSSCGICTLVCPHGVRVMEINTQAKAKKAESEPLSRKKIRSWLLGHNAWWGVLGTPFAPFLNWLFTFFPFRFVAEKTLGISRRAPFPKWAGYTFRGWWKRRKAPVLTSPPDPLSASREGENTVVYYHGCSTNTYEPRIGKLAVKVLEHNGFRVVVPDQGCCGLPLQSNGMFDEARQFARRNTKSLAEYARKGIPIIGTASSCIMALKGDYQHILGMEDNDTRVVAGDVYDICEFLAKLNVEGKLKTDFRSVDDYTGIVPYHIPCQLKAHGVGRPALDVLDLIPGLRAVEMDADCCGIAGTYGYKSEKRQISEDVGKHLFDRIKQTGSPVAICDTETCRWQIGQMTGARVVHPIEVIARAYGISAED
ncbi:MAG: anaerobic glycerol-3-phosphate dehydrogenase subunit C [Anaerolineae bacterium]|nr:anaerobic glycerol-3-phosphate dehydrogenase subunit C [Anaerolineae bacterium]